MRDEADFTRMFQESYEPVLRYAWRRVGGADAPDVAAETFKIAWEKYERFPRDEPLPWLYATARNVAANLIRKDRRRDGLVDRLGGELTRQAVESDHGGSVLGALAALKSLSDEERELVLLVSWEGLDLRQAAKAAGCSRPAAAMRLHRARKRLRQLFTDDNQPAFRGASYQESTT